jgi:hypothetical protein
VHNRAQAVKIELDHEHYAALIVEVEDPAATVRTINAAVHGLGSGGWQGAPRDASDASDPT